MRGIDLGADDYLTKPFGPAELLARVRANPRRRGPSEVLPSTFKVDDLTINLARRSITCGGQEIRLTPTEYKLRYELATNAGKVMLHSNLLSRVCGLSTAARSTISGRIPDTYGTRSSPTRRIPGTS